MSMPITDILQDFAHFDGIYKQQAVESAIANQTEITPHLIQILEDILVDPEEYLTTADNFAHIYAVILLGYFKAQQAHTVLIRVFSLPATQVVLLFSDIISQDLAMILYRTFPGSPDNLKALILNRDAFRQCRASAMKALVFAVAEGKIAHQDTLNFLGSLFTGNEAQRGSAFWSLVAANMCKLYPVKLLSLLEQAFAAGLINMYTVGLDNFNQAINGTLDQALAKVQIEITQHPLNDIQQRMAWWATNPP